MEQFTPIYKLMERILSTTMRGVIHILSTIICTHSTLAEGFKSAIEMICGKQDNCYAFGFYEGDDFFSYTDIIKNRAVEELNKGNKVLCFVDLPHATPFNTCIYGLSELDVLIITGVNLPILLEIINLNHDSLNEDYIENAIKSARTGLYKTSAKLFLAKGESND